MFCLGQLSGQRSRQTPAEQNRRVLTLPRQTAAPLTMYEKIWEAHVVHEAPGEPALIYIDRHLIHEVTSAQAFAGLEAAGRKVRRPDLTFAVMDHSVPTRNRYLPIMDHDAARSLRRWNGDLPAARHSSFRSCPAATRASCT